jgi:hypothetical protein
LSLSLSQLHKDKWCASLERDCSCSCCNWDFGFWLDLVSWLWFGLSAWFLVILAWCATLRERCATLVGYWSAIEIILSVKVKVLRGGICAYGWVAILLYFLWKNEHVSLFLTTQTSVGFAQGSLDLLGSFIPVGDLFPWRLLAQSLLLSLLARPPTSSPDDCYAYTT